MLNTHGHLFFEGPQAVWSIWNEVYRWICDVVLCPPIWSSAGQNASVTWQSNPHLLDIPLDMPRKCLFWAQIQILSRSFAVPRKAMERRLTDFLILLALQGGPLHHPLRFCFLAMCSELLRTIHMRRTRCSEIILVLGWEVCLAHIVIQSISYIFAAEAEWILSETMTGFLENFNLLRMFRVARIIRPLTLVLKFSTLNTGVSSRKCLWIAALNVPFGEFGEPHQALQVWFRL